MPHELSQIAPRFVAMAHVIGMAVAATVDDRGNPRTRLEAPAPYAHTEPEVTD